MFVFWWPLLRHFRAFYTLFLLGIYGALGEEAAFGWPMGYGPGMWCWWHCGKALLFYFEFSPVQFPCTAGRSRSASFSSEQDGKEVECSCRRRVRAVLLSSRPYTDCDYIFTQVNTQSPSADHGLWCLEWACISRVGGAGMSQSCVCVCVLNAPIWRISTGGIIDGGKRIAF